MKQTLIREYFEKNNGILNILPTFVPRRFCKAGHRLRLHPDDYFALGTHRGAIKERWFSSVICAMNGPAAAPAAAKGVTIENHRSCEPLVLLKHFPVYDGMPQ